MKNYTHIQLMILNLKNVNKEMVLINTLLKKTKLFHFMVKVNRKLNRGESVS